MSANCEPIGQDCQVQDSFPLFMTLDLWGGRGQMEQFLKSLLILKLEEQRLEVGHNKNE